MGILHNYTWLFHEFDGLYDYWAYDGEYDEWMVNMMYMMDVLCICKYVGLMMYLIDGFEGIGEWVEELPYSWGCNIQAF